MQHRLINHAKVHEGKPKIASRSGNLLRRCLQRKKPGPNFGRENIELAFEQLVGETNIDSMRHLVAYVANGVEKSRFFLWNNLQ